MNKLKILHLEDTESDAEIISWSLKKGGIDADIKLISNKEEYKKELRSFNPDIILSDHSMFQFDSIEALQIFKEFDLDIPFILVTGTVSEEFAAEILKSGADDYLLKNNLTRLPNAINLALKEKHANREKQKAIDNLLLLFKNIGEVFFSFDVLTGKLLQISDACYKIYGHKPEAFINDTTLWKKVIFEDDKEISQAFDLSKIRNEVSAEYRIVKPDKSLCWVQTKFVPTFDKENNLVRIDGVTSDVNAMKIVEKNLEKKCEELSHLMYRLSHDLRGPIASTAGLVNVAKSEIKDPMASAYLGMIEQSNSRLDKILRGIIQLISIERGNITETKLNFHEMMSGILRFYKEETETQNISFITDIRIKNELVYNEQFIHSILYNLIANAVNYRQSNSPFVKILIEEKSNHLIIQVKDNGIGIKKEFQENIFSLFFKASERSQGSGLGLYITKTIVDKYSGLIKLESDYNQGSVFTITLPVQVNSTPQPIC